MNSIKPSSMPLEILLCESNGNVRAKCSAYRCFDRRTVAEMEKKVVKQGKRNAVSRFVLAKGDKDKIIGWKQDLFRVLHVFNVSSINSVWHSRT